MDHGRAILLLLLTLFAVSMDGQDSPGFSALYESNPCDRLIEEVQKYPRDSLSAQACIYSGVCLMQQAEYQSALGYLDQAIRLDRGVATGYFFKAEVLFHLNRLKEALIQYDNAIYLQPEVPDFQVGKGYALFLAGRHAEALACFEGALSKPSCPEQAFVLLARTYQEMGETGKALETYTRALEHLRPGEAVFRECLHRMGLAQYLAGDYPGAGATFNRLLALDREDFQALARLVQVHFALGEYARGNALKMELYNAFQRGLLPAEWEEKGFCFDQFEWDGKRIYAYERFKEPAGFESKHILYVTGSQNQVLETFQTERRPEAALFGKKYILTHSKGTEHVIFEREAFDDNLDYSVLKKSVIRMLKAKNRSGFLGGKK
jgi:tetratricopeptide (TPR) repeat protein